MNQTTTSAGSKPGTTPVATSWIDITPGFAGYLALPPARRGPGLLLFQEIFGVNPHIRAVAEQYAMDGFVVLAPDVFWRQAPRIELGYSEDDIGKGRAVMQALKPDESIADIASSLAALRARPEAAGAKVGAVGYCMGGRLAYLAAATTDIAAAAPFYGGGIQTQLDRAASIRCPVQFHYAEQDHAIPLEAVEQVKAAMQGKPAEFHLYPGAQHGFNCWARGTYHAPSAALAHGRALQFFAKHLF